MVVVVMTAISSSAALAQGGPSLDPSNRPGARGNAPSGNQDNTIPTAAPQPGLNKTYPVWLGYVVIFLMVVVIMGISLMPSKRSHQD